MANAERQESAEFAEKCGHVAPGEAPDLHEYSFTAGNGEPEGCIFAECHEEAARLWGYDLLNGCTRLMQVWGPGDERGRWFRIERRRDDVSARECSQ